MYRSLLTFVVLSVANYSLAQQSTSLLCRGNMAKYCRPTSPHNYGLPHNDYFGYVQTTATTAPPIAVSQQTTTAPILPNNFEDLAQNLIAAESAIRKYCLDNQVADVKEVYGKNYYILRYTLRDAEQSGVTVQIKHTVIYVTAVKLGVTILRDLRILPNILITAQASWALGNDKLEIFFPYATRNKKNSEKCPSVIDTLINVPKSMFTYRSGDHIVGQNQQQSQQQSQQQNQPQNQQQIQQQNQQQIIGPNSNDAGNTNNGQDDQEDSLSDVLAFVFGDEDDQQNIDVRDNSVV